MKFTDRLKQEGITPDSNIKTQPMSFTDRLKASEQPEQITPTRLPGIQEQQEYEQQKWQEGTDDFSKQDDEWRRINRERAQKRTQAEQDRKPTALKALENFGGKMKKTIFGEDAQTEVQRDLGTNMSTGNKVLDTAVDIGGTIAGYAMPIPGAQGGSLISATNDLAAPFTQRILSKVGNKPIGRIASGVAEGAITGAPLGLYEGVTQNLTPGETAKKVVQETAIGGIAGGALSGIGEGISALRKGSKTAQKAVETVDNINLQPSKIEQPKPATERTVLEKLTGTNKSADDLQKEITSLRETKADYEKRYNDIIGKPKEEVDKLSLGAQIYRTKTIKDLEKLINETDNKIKVNLQLFAEKSKAQPSVQGMKQSKFAQTVSDSNNTSPELAQSINNADIQYKIKPNEQTLQRAKNIIDSDIDEAIRMVKSNEPSTAESNAVSQLLVQKFQQEGRWQDALDIVEKTSLKATQQGQAIQALSMWNRLTPEGMLKYAQRVVDNANTGIKDANKKIKLTPEFAEDLANDMNKISEMVDGRDKDIDDFEVPYEEGMSVLDALRWIRIHLDSTLGIRYSCINASSSDYIS